MRRPTTASTTGATIALWTQEGLTRNLIISWGLDFCFHADAILKETNHQTAVFLRQFESERFMDMKQRKALSICCAFYGE